MKTRQISLLPVFLVVISCATAPPSGPVGVLIDNDLDGVRNTYDLCPDTPRLVAVDDRGCALAHAPVTPPPMHVPQNECIQLTGTPPGMYVTVKQGVIYLMQDGRELILEEGHTGFADADSMVCIEQPPEILAWPCTTIAAQSRIFASYTIEELATSNPLKEIVQRYFDVPEVLAPAPNWIDGEYTGVFNYHELDRYSSNEYWYHVNPDAPLLSEQRPKLLLVSLYVGTNQVVLDHNVLDALRQELDSDDIPVTFVFNDSNTVPISYFGSEVSLQDVFTAFYNSRIKVAPVPMWWQGDYHLLPTIGEFEAYFNIPTLNEIKPEKQASLKADLEAYGFSRKPIMVTLFAGAGTMAVDQPERIRVAASIGFDKIPTIINFIEADALVAQCGPGTPTGVGAVSGSSGADPNETDCRHVPAASPAPCYETSGGWGSSGNLKKKYEKDTDRDGVADSSDQCPGTPGVVVGKNGCPLPPPPLPALAWPPPEPSYHEPLPESIKRDSDTSLLDISDRLSGILHAAGYAQQTFYSVPASDGYGFALVTRLERFDGTGAPLGGDKRFRPPLVEDTEVDLTEFIKSLFITPSGSFRFLVFVITDQPFVASGQQIDAAQAQGLLKGPKRLPSTYKAKQSLDDFHVDVLIYEYKWHEGLDEAEKKVPGEHSVLWHISGSGLAAPLGFSDK